VALGHLPQVALPARPVSTPASQGASPERARQTAIPKEIDMRPTLFNMIAFALVFVLANIGLIAIGYALLK
jgi:hypothetical protein